MIANTPCPKCGRPALEHIHAFTNARSLFCDACGYRVEPPPAEPDPPDHPDERLAA